MTPIENIPTQELLDDKEESLIDINVCKAALAVGVTTYSSGDVSERLRINQEIVQKIDAELKRRFPQS